MEGERPNQNQGLTQIGNQAVKIAKSLSHSVSTLESKETPSLTGRLPTESSMPAHRQGTGTGVATLPATVMNALSGADAWSTDKALVASLPPSVRSRLKSKVNNDFDLIGYELSDRLDRDDAGAALAVVEASCKPCNPTVALSEVGGCFAATTAREHDQLDIQVTLKAMVAGLAEFPEDVIRDACRAYARCHKWRPSLSELREFCWPRFRARDSLRSVLRKAVA